MIRARLQLEQTVQPLIADLASPFGIGVEVRIRAGDHLKSGDRRILEAADLVGSRRATGKPKPRQPDDHGLEDL